MAFPNAWPLRDQRKFHGIARMIARGQMFQADRAFAYWIRAYRHRAFARVINFRSLWFQIIRLSRSMR